MSDVIDVLTVVGARPQFVKAATLSRAFIDHGGFSERILHTGQHFDANMSGSFFEELSIPEPTHNLNISGGGHGQMTGRMLEGIEALMTGRLPHAMLVYGDTNSTIAGALAAAKLHVPVIHVEAGLRSFNRQMPEEVNRVLTDHISALLLCPTIQAIQNLSAEGIVENVHHVGDVMFDATLFAKEKAAASSSIVSDLNLESGNYVVATVHRAENTDHPTSLQHVVSFLQQQAEHGDVVLPLHPRTKAAFKRYQIVPEGIKMIEPVGYLDMQKLLGNAKIIVTDSGGVQKEAYFHGVRCITLRDETEWVETVRNGWNRLWGKEDYMPRKPIDEYGKGDAAGRCADIIFDFLTNPD